MYGRKLRCPQGSAVEHGLRETSAGHGSYLVKKGLVLWGCAAVSLALSAQAVAQSTTLPQVTVEGKGTTAKKGTAKGAPKAAPQQPAEPVQQVETQAAKEKAQQEAVYNTPAAVSTADQERARHLRPGRHRRRAAHDARHVHARKPAEPGSSAVNIRGFEGSGRVNMMIDGVRQNFRFTGHEAQGFAYVDPSLLAGVDIARGAVVDGGRCRCLGWCGQSSHARRRRHHQARQERRRADQLHLRHQWRGLEEMLAGGVTNGNVGIAGAISHHEPDNYKNGDGMTVPFTRQDLLSGLFKMDFRLSSEQSLKLGRSGLRQRLPRQFCIAERRRRTPTRPSTLTSRSAIR